MGKVQSSLERNIRARAYLEINFIFLDVLQTFGTSAFLPIYLALLSVLL